MSGEPVSQSSRNTLSVLLLDYMQQVAPTDRLSQDDLRPVLMGVFGEVGSIMATAKKLHRENQAYAGYQHAVEEEFGDALWYLTALCRRLYLGVDDIFRNAQMKKDTALRLPPVILLMAQSLTFHRLMNCRPLTRRS